jgi:ubiquinone/menaquinone biosynthesis C-methylase UbiE
MVALAQSRLPDGVVMVGDALDLPFADDSFDRILTGHFYGHLPPEERELFLAEARRVAGELVVVDAALRDDSDPEQWEERVLMTNRGIRCSSATSGASSSLRRSVVRSCTTERGSSWHARPGRRDESKSTPGKRWLSAMCETTSSGYELPVDAVGLRHA